MRLFSRRGIFPWFTVIEGVAGFFMQCWLFSTADRWGLLPRYHFSGFVSFFLLALTFFVCFMGARQEKDVSPEKLFLAYPPAAAGIGLSAIGFAISSFTVSGLSFLRFLTPVLGVLSAAALIYAAYCRMKGRQADGLLYCIVIVFLILRTMSCCSAWGSEPQLMRYFFPLLACVLLLVASYYRAALAIGEINYRRYVFFSQVALFCCCLSCRGGDWLFFLSAVLWLTCDFPAPSSLRLGRFM